MAKVGVILAGSGVYDGAEIHEAVCTLLHLDRRGAQVQCLAPNIPQLHVVNHLTGQVAPDESRNVLVEAARIARGAIVDLSTVDGGDFDAVILPGGFGVAKNLCTFAVDGPACSVDPEVERFLRQAQRANKVIGLLCIAPVLAAKVFGAHQPQLTIGNDPDTAQAIETMGGQHLSCPVREIVIDAPNRIVTSPAYMLGQSISEVYDGIGKLVEAVLELAGG